MFGDDSFLRNECINPLMAVKTRSKAILAYGRGHGKSPCFSEVEVLQVIGPDYSLSVLPCLDGAENMECAL